MTTEDADAVVVGAGPSGAATALLLARAGHPTVVIDRSRFPRDKPCGEGLMPPGVAALRRLGLLGQVLATGAPRLGSVTYRMVGAPGALATAPFPAPPGGRDRWGLGVRRLRFDAVLAAALGEEPGVRLIEGVRADGLLRDRHGRITGVRAGGSAIGARVVIAADGLHSPMRAAAGWASPTPPRRRYGLAGHWRVETGAIDGITISLADGHEWYQAPVGTEELLVSVLGGRRQIGPIAAGYEAAARAALPWLRGAELLGHPLSAGLFQQRPLRIAGDGLFLVGDAAGYDDPTTGEGIAAGLLMAERLATRLHGLLRQQVSPDEAVAAYTRDHRRLWADRRRLTRLALVLGGHPAAARRAIAALARRPRALETLLGLNCGYWGFGRLRPRDWLALTGL